MSDFNSSFGSNTNQNSTLGAPAPSPFGGGTVPPGPQGSRRRGRVALIASLSTVVLLLGLGGAGFWAVTSGPLSSLFAAPDDFPGPGKGEVMFTINEGEIGDQIANNLVEAGVIKSFDPFYTLLLNAEPQVVFVPGVFKLKLEMSAQGALDALQNLSNLVTVTVVIPEGERMTNVLQEISTKAEIPLSEVQTAAADVASFGLPAEAVSLEGFLYPATYDFSPGLTAHEILQAMVDRCFEALDAAGVSTEDRYRIITFASLVQKESGLRDDFYKVARVFQNRLDQGWNMESDATVAYGTGATNRVETTSAERADEGNPYNTYVHPGLPFAPICNPSDLAIDAVLHPADGPWMFFVTWNLDTGETIFSETADEHAAGVEKWIAWMDEHPEYG
ncbi:MAG: endolytic transglycosylase MltG [Microbacteriaceae bacterium]|jgi:UPF0755 protein